MNVGLKSDLQQMVRAMTARHVAGAEYPKDRLFPAI